MDIDSLASARHRAAEPGVGVVQLFAMLQDVRGSLPAPEVAELYAIWIEHHPNDPLLYAMLFNQSVVLAEINDLYGAMEALQRVLKINPDFMPAVINLGRIHERLGVPGLALRFWAGAVEKLAAVNGSAITHKVTALNQSARVLESAHQDAEAEPLLAQSLDLDPTQREAMEHYVALRQRQCKWPAIVPTERMDRRAMVRGLSPLSAAALTDDPMFHLALAVNCCRREPQIPAIPLPARTTDRTSNLGRLRIGYLSSDLRAHAVGNLMAEVFALHDTSRVEVFAYYCGPEPTVPDALYARFQATAEHWVPITQMDDASAAARIVTDRIDILVDVNGHTRDSRPRVLSMRPAPVIVNWLGYPGTMGSPHHHYIIADDWIIPPDDEIYYSETVARLPCYQPNDRRRAVAERTPTRAEAGLPDDAMVFCSFNAGHKFTRFTFDRWLSILNQVPDSVLWLLAPPDATCVRLREYAEAHGLPRERLLFAEKVSHPIHLARHGLADLFLDTMPYGAHTTASDALWMGLPVLTWSGRSFASRVCGSLVRSAGLPELVCLTAEDYEGRAVALGRERATLREYRERLRAQRDRCVLFDSPGLVRSLEDVYAAMWQDHVAGRIKRPDLANMDIYLDVAEAIDPEETEVARIPDYRAWWRHRLAEYDALRPIPRDRRLCDGFG